MRVMTTSRASHVTAVGLLVASLVLAWARPAFADSACDQNPPPDFCGGGVIPPTTPTPPVPPAPPSNPDPNLPTTYRWYGPGQSLDPLGNVCWTVELESIELTPPPPGQSYIEVLRRIATFDGNGVLYDVCPQLIVDLAGGAASEWWTAAWLPTTTLEVDPGIAITGLTSYLEVTSGAIPTPPAVSTPFGPLRIVVNAPTNALQWCKGCDWKDPKGSSGGPYPNGDLTHVYTDEGRERITWTMNWTASFVVDGLGSFLLPSRDQTFTLDLDIESRQATLTG